MTRIMQIIAAATAAAALLLPTVPARAENSDPVTIRAVGGANMGGTWNIAFTALGKLLGEKHPGSRVNIILGATVSNPLKLEANGGDVSCTQSYNITAGLKGQPPYKAPFRHVSSIGNVGDTTLVHILVNADVPATSLEEIVEKRIPIRVSPGPKGTLSNVLGGKLLKELGASYGDIEKWGGKVSPVNADKVSLMKDGTLNCVIIFASLQQAALQELAYNGCRWLSVRQDVLEKVAKETGLRIADIPADLYGGAVGRNVPSLADTVHIICRTELAEDDVYKITKAFAEGADYIHEVLPAWKTLAPQTMPEGLIAPLHPGAERYYREAGIIR